MSYKKYYIYKQQYSEDGGITWKDTDPLVTSPSGDPIGEYATLEECQGITPSQYRWVNMDPSTDYYCEGTNKYYKQKKQVSYDDGQTWQDVSPAEYQKGGVAETESTDCGYVPPIPTNKKLAATYTGGTTREVECNSSTELTSGETRPSGYQASAMTSASIGGCVSSIGNYAFNQCTSLSSVLIPDSVTSIGKGAFEDCGRLTSINIPTGLTSIENYVFEGCSGLTSVDIPNGVTYIGASAFSDCTSLPSITIPNSVTSIGYNAFESCSGLTSVDIPNSVTYIGASAFHYCFSLTSATIGSSVETIGKRAFYNCTSLTSVNIPNSVTYIGDYAINSCYHLTSVSIGSGVATIGASAFGWCTGLTTVTIEATTPPTLGGQIFGNTPIASGTGTIYVPAASVNAYKTAQYWSTYASRIRPIS